ncbi:MAG: sporulation protein YqfD [Clostridia bacterium]|nr:sporulation protein YqfD [Clostridia bacterium]
MKTRMLITGMMPERALNRLQRAGIAVEKVKKRKKNEIVFTVDEKDCEKVFAIYPNICYNNRGYTPYTAQILPKTGVAKLWSGVKKRVGLALGAAIWLFLTAFSDSFVLSVKILGETPYETEIMRILDEGGATHFSRYDGKNADLLSSRILALDGVSYCSVKKVGTTLVVEVVGGSFPKAQAFATELISDVSGEITELTVLRGEALKSVGELVEAGEALARAIPLSDSAASFVIARASVACVYEGEGADEQSAIANGLLCIGAENDEVKVKEIAAEEWEGGVRVKISYERILHANFLS